MLIDLHCHTSARSACSTLDPRRLVELAVERGFDGICLTEHDQAWPEPELRALSEATGFPVFGAVEYTVAEGHVLAFGRSGGGVFGSAAPLFEAAEREGALLFLAHPARDGTLRVTADTVRWFAGVEAANGSDGRLQNLASAGLAKGFRLPGIGGSDAHTEAEVGRAGTRFEADIRTALELLEALRSGAYEAVTLA